MADGLPMCAVLVFIAAVGGTGILSAKGFYCRDPDTGKLYHINATWPSDSFCGSYTCRIRKRNLTDYEYLPFRQLNITEGDIINRIELDSPVVNNSTDNNDAESIMDEVKMELMASNTGVNSKDIENQEDPKNVALQKFKELQAMSDKGDRYLTSPEIKALTDLIHSVKKSDVESILEIYNIAKDIYKELDKTADENILEKTIEDITQNSDDIRKAMGKTNVKPTSYWYEPLTVSNSKVKVAEDGMYVGPINKEKSDLHKEGANPKNTQLPYLNAFHRDLAKLPYYYPMSNFQRLSSYVHQPYTNPPYAIPAKAEKTPCKKKEHFSPWNNLLIKKPIEPPIKGINPQEPVFLPFPFAYVHHYNYSKAMGPYDMNEKPWTNLKFYTQPQKTIPSYVNAAYIARLPNAVLINQNLKDEIRHTNIKQKAIDLKNPTKQELLVNVLDDLSNKPKKSLEWQTDDLPTSVLDEIKGNILSKSKLLPFPLRKKVKLERVNKVIKIEEHSRSKRQTTDDIPTEVYEGYDVYLEKNTCQLENEPGFFRVGNLTEPFPACCPQRIGKQFLL